MLKERVRVYALARELNMDSKDLLDLCRQAGFDVKNQLSSLDPDQQDAVQKMLKKGGRGASPAAPAAQNVPVISSNLDTKVRVLTQRKKDKETETAVPQEAPAAEAPPEPATTVEETPPPAEVDIPEPAVESPEPAEEPAPVAAQTVPEQPATAPVEAKPSEPPARAPEVPSKQVGPMKVPSLPSKSETGTRQRTPRTIRPVMSRLAQPPALKKVAPKKEEKSQPVQKPIARPDAFRKGNISPQEAIKEAMKITVAPSGTPSETEDDDDKKGKSRPGGVAGRDQRHRKRSERAQVRRDRQEVEALRGGRVVTEEDRPQRTKHRLKEKRRPITEKRKGKVPIEMPITVRSLSEALGIRAGDLLFRLRGHGAPASTMINSTIDAELAETIALDTGTELEIKKPLDAEEQLLAEFEKQGGEDDLVPRAPVVTVMGHVDHGKTSLLDKIRQTNVVDTEIGGITQVIRAWRVEHHGKYITFLDTPGHEAFTKMRARGAQVTDVVVIVVAADDGVMPQTEEAINHAKAAGVPMVVAINKIDLPNANITKTRQQLYSLELLPDNMGGDIPFVEASAAKGTGIDELLENISLVAELRELKAQPNKAGQGTCLEAMLSEGEGVQATLLVRDGTLNKGDVIFCGSAFGRVRAMYDDQGRPIEQAGPSVPVRITGLDSVPNADDPFYVVPDLSTARDIAERRKERQQEASLVQRAPLTLENLSQAKIAELKVILKADFRGSIEAIRKEMEKLHHEEVRVNILHAAIGGITESDVVLALTSPEDTVIVGFNVVPDDRAKALADEREVEIRQYNIIYNLTNDIRSALEGKLKPHEQVVHLGRAVVRETFKISRVGTVAGCYVTQGTIERAAKIRVIRQGVVIYPPPERVASLETLKRFKEDTKEVRDGFECGIKIAGYDDIKLDDVIEAYRIEQVQRTL